MWSSYVRIVQHGKCSHSSDNMYTNKSGRLTIKINVQCSTHNLLVIINLYLHSRHINVHTTDYAIRNYVVIKKPVFPNETSHTHTKHTYFPVLLTFTNK